LKGLGGAGALIPASVVAPMFVSPSLICPTALSGRRKSARPPRSISAGTVERSRSASPSSFAGPGSGLALQGEGGAGVATGSRAVSNRTVVMSTPEIPSTSAWWVFATSAKRFPAIACTSQISHSGFERSRRCEKSRPASCLSAVSSAGFGSAVWRMW
jgi:hypothetical protein